MNYLEWELERQRGALRALLGGGGRDGEALRKDGTERKPAEPETAEQSAGPSGRSAVSGGREAGPPAGRERDLPAEWANLRRDGTGRREEISGGELAAPVSAWEQVTAGEEDAPEQVGGPGERPPEVSASPPQEGTGPQAALSGASGPAAGGAEAAASPRRAERRRNRESGGGTAAEAFTTGYRPAKRLPAWAPETGVDSGFAAARAEEDRARALSRAVQRDARRYDGGFTIY